MKLYIETTVPNFLFADDAPEKKNVTEHFFDWVLISSDTFHVSSLVFEEINRAQEPLRTKLLNALGKIPTELLLITDEAVGLAGRYVADGVVPARFKDDALHVAIAVLNRLDVVVTWNMKHLANVRRIERINHTNLIMGLNPIRIHTPEEVIGT